MHPCTCWGSLVDPAAAAAAAASGEGEGARAASSAPSNAAARATTGPAANAHSPGREVHRPEPNWELRAWREYNAQGR